MNYKLLSVLFIALGVPLVSAPSANAANQRTFTKWSAIFEAEKGVDVIPYVKADKHGIFVDFEDKDFNDIEYVYYNLNYDTNEKAMKRGVEGSFVPSMLSPTAHYKGNPYYRVELVLGTCSQGVCNYHKGVRNVKLTVNTKMKSGAVEQYTKVLNFSDSQF